MITELVCIPYELQASHFLYEQPETKDCRRQGIVSTLLYLYNAICPQNTIKKEILDLFENRPDIPIFKSGFTKDWRKNPLWR